MIQKESVHRGGHRSALLTDLYELTMLQAYWRTGMTADAVFSLFVRRLPPSRNVLLACGLDDVLEFLEGFRFEAGDLAYLEDLGSFSGAFLDWLGKLRFAGDVFAVPEGTPVFAEEPILEVVAPLPQAQIVESLVMNQVHFQTVAASKASRVVRAARGRTVVDFGMRRMHGAEAAVKSARAFYVAGVDATSNVFAGRRFGLPVAGTMAHSFIQAHDNELEAFRAFVAAYPDTILLIDTYDTAEGARNVVRLARELGGDFRVRGVRLDSGDLGALALEVRAILDGAGLERVEIFASGSLDEYEIDALVRDGAPITGFGVGTRMGVSKDAPSLDMAYKLTAYAGTGRTKFSAGKRILPGQKQIFRVERDGGDVRDVLGLMGEEIRGRPLLEKAMEGGRRLAPYPAPRRIRDRAAGQLGRLPATVRGIEPAEPPYPVALSPALTRLADQVADAVTRTPT